MLLYNLIAISNNIPTQDDILPWIIACAVILLIGIVFLIVFNNIRYKYWRRFFVIIIIASAIALIYFVFYYFRLPY